MNTAAISSSLKSLAGQDPNYEQLLFKIQEYAIELEAQEKENNCQKGQLQQELEDAHQQIRKLESENLNLRFEIFDLKRKHKDLSDQLEKSKVLHDTSGRNDSYPQSPCFRSFDSKIFDAEPKNLGRQFQLSSEEQPRLSEDEVQTPKDISSPLSLNSPQLRSFGRSQSFMELNHPLSARKLVSQRSQILSPRSNNENSSNLTKRKSTFFKEANKKRMEEEVPDSANKRTYSRNLSRKLSDDCQGSTFHDDSAENAHPPFRRLRSFSCDFSEEQAYLSAFNTLSENIVSLGVKPQMAMNEHGDDYDPSANLESHQHHAKTHKVQYISKDLNLVNSDHNVPTKTEPTHKQKNLFENFLVLGVENHDIKSFTEKNPEKRSGVRKWIKS